MDRMLFESFIAPNRRLNGTKIKLVGRQNSEHSENYYFVFQRDGILTTHAGSYPYIIVKEYECTPEMSLDSILGTVVNEFNETRIALDYTD